MKTAIYIEDGTVQLVITPETEFEKNALKMFQSKPTETQIFDGSFYDCRGGWIRQNAHYHYGYGNDWESRDKSLILRIDTKEPKQDEPFAQVGGIEEPPA